MNKKYTVFFITAALFAATQTAQAQKDTTSLKQEVEVVKAYRPSVANADKLNQLPVIDDSTRFTPEFNYNINSRPVTSGFETAPIGAAKIEGNPKSNQGYGLLKAGVGNYSTPYGELFFNKPGSKNGTFGLHLKHLSSQGMIKLAAGDKVDAPYSHNLAEIYGSIILPKVTLAAEANYTRDANNFYGYPTEIPDDLLTNGSAPLFGKKQWYQKAKIGFTAMDNGGKNDLFNYKTGFYLQNFNALTDQVERSGGLFANFRYDANVVKLFLDASFDNYRTDSVSYYLNYNNPLTSQNRSWLTVKPSAQLDGKNWKARVGINFFSVFDKYGDNDTKMYPKIDLEFTPVEQIMTIYAGLDGYLKNNHLSLIASENPWINPAADVAPTDYQYIAFGGFKGKIINGLTYNIGLTYSKANDKYLYVVKYYDNNIYQINNPANQYYDNAFMVDYDDLSITDFSGEITYAKGSQLYISFTGHYYSYSVDRLNAASHLPQYALNLNGQYRITDRISAFAEIDLTGKREVLIGAFLPPYSSIAAPEPTTEQLDQVINIKIGADYQLLSNLKLFVRVDNLLNQKYDHYFGYRAQGIRGMAGATLNF